MDIQDLFESLSPMEQRMFAVNNKESLIEYFLEDNSFDLSGYSKEELVNALKGEDLGSILYGAECDINEVKSWLENELRN